MSAESKQAPQPPPLTAQDFQVLMNYIVGLVAMGVTLLEFHPVRWGIVVGAFMNYGSALALEVVADEDGKVRTIPIGVMLGDGKPLQITLKLFEPCTKEGCTACPDLLAQGDNYPVPEERSMIIAPGRGGRGPLIQ